MYPNYKDDEIDVMAQITTQKEIDAYNPSSPYAASKACSDLIIKSYIRNMQFYCYKMSVIIVKKELKDNNITSIEQLSSIMNTNYTNINPRFHPYRNKNYTQKKNRNSKSNFNVNTTGQIIFNMSDLELTYYADVNTSEKVKYINLLPKDYTPKIRIFIKETNKNVKRKKTIFTQKYLKKFEEKFRCKT